MAQAKEVKSIREPENKKPDAEDEKILDKVNEYR